MKRFYALMLLSLMASYSAIAQETDSSEPKFYSGIKGGINITNLVGNLEGASAQIGGHVGVYTLQKLSPVLGVQPEILFSVHGAKVEEGHVRLHYINVPVLLKVNADPNLSFQAGPYVGLLISGKYKKDRHEADFKGKNKDFGIAYGFTAGNESKFSVTVRHYIGLTNLVPQEINRGSEIAKLRNQVFQISLGICFNKDY